MIDLYNWACSPHKSHHKSDANRQQPQTKRAIDNGGDSDNDNDNDGSENESEKEMATKSKTTTEKKRTRQTIQQITNADEIAASIQSRPVSEDTQKTKGMNTTHAVV